MTVQQESGENNEWCNILAQLKTQLEIQDFISDAELRGRKSQKLSV